MKILYPNLITGIACSSVNENYPAANVLIDIPKKVWQSATQDAGTMELSLTEETAITDLFIYNSNITGTFETKNSDNDTIDTGNITFLNDVCIYPVCWIELSGEPVKKIILNINSTLNDYHYIGIVYAGVSNVFRNPKWGLQSSVKDNSLTFEMNDRSTNYIKREKTRTYSGSLDVTLDSTTSDSVFFDTVLDISPAPVPVKLLSDGDIYQSRYVFGKITGSGTTNYINRGSINFDIQEIA